jgi:small-conductance mechanosensitive channel
LPYDIFRGAEGGENGWIASICLYLGVLLGISALAYALVLFAEKQLVRRRIWPPKFSFVSRFFLSVEFLLVSIALLFLPKFVAMPTDAALAFRAFNRFALIASATWLILKVIDAITALCLRNLRVDHPDNLRERRLRTQILYLEKVVDAVLILVSIGLLLVGFERFRRIGGSLLASAGFASLIVGLAAQRSLGSLIAGMQVAFTQPIRLGDAVLVENEWGEIEEITLTYVVVRLWDLRRLVVPINYFLEKPFQNWTRTSADLVGSVSLSVDYNVPVEVMRAELSRLLSANPLWDGKVSALQMIDANEKSVTLRALMSARSAGAVWDLRCSVRESLVAFVRDHYPESLPRSRVESPQGNPAPAHTEAG